MWYSAGLTTTRSLVRIPVVLPKVKISQGATNTWRGQDPREPREKQLLLIVSRVPLHCEELRDIGGLHLNLPHLELQLLQPADEDLGGGGLLVGSDLGGPGKKIEFIFLTNTFGNLDTCSPKQLAAVS